MFHPFIFLGSPQFTGQIPAYGLVDAQFNFALSKLNSVLKIGASNVFEQQSLSNLWRPQNWKDGLHKLSL